MLRKEIQTKLEILEAINTGWLTSLGGVHNPYNINMVD